MSSCSVNRQPSYLSAVNRREELDYRDVNPQQVKNSQFRRSAAGMYSIPENEEFEQQRHLVARNVDSDVLENQRMVHPRVGTGAGLAAGNWGELLERYKETTADDDEDFRTYIRPEDVRKVLNGQKMAAVRTTSGGPAGSGGAKSGLSGSRASASGASRRSGRGDQTSERWRHSSTAGFQSDVPRWGADAVDSLSIGSQKDSGYRSNEEDRHSAEDCPSNSPTLSASNSAASLTTTAVDANKYLYPLRFQRIITETRNHLIKFSR